MAKYILYNKEGSAVIDKQNNEIIVSGIEYSGKWMGECFVTVTIKSAYPIDFNIGDYLIYRDEKFELKTVPTVNKKARTGTYGEGYVYDNIKLYSLTNETTDVMFHDQVLYDNNVHYSSLPNFSFYCETIDDLADRLQANMNRYCENNGYEDIDFWLFFTPNKNRTIQRARSVSETFAQNASLKWDTYFNLGTETSEEKTKLSLSCSSQTVWEACQLIKTSFGLNFIAKNRNIVIGAAGLPTNHLFKYGKDNGLYEIYRTVDSAQKVTTRVFAYGSDKNMPNHYYQDMETLPNNMALQVLMLPGFPKLSLNDICKATYNSVSNTTTFSIRKNKTSEYSDFLTVEGKHIPVFSSDPLKPYIDSGNASELGIHEGDVSFTEENDDNGLKSIYPSIEGMTAGDVFGTTSTDRLDEILSADVITDNGIFDDGATIPNFKVRLKNIGFDLQSAMLSSGQMTIGFTDGYCGGREFKVQSCITELDGTNTLTLERVEDNGVYFPCAWNNEAQSGYPYQISAGDHFYLTGININDTNYIYAATIKLLRKTLLWLFNNDHVRYTYQPKIDEIYMARQHEIAINNDNVISLHDTIKEGDLLLFSDDDLGISGSVYIDQLVIKEDGNNGIPTYEVTLRNDVSVGTLQRIQNQIDSLTYATNGVKSNIAGYTNTTQVKRIVEAYGGDLFVSKVQDDTVQGFITFLKGLEATGRTIFHDEIRSPQFEPGSYDGSGWRIDQFGNAEFESARVRSYLEVVELLINRLQAQEGDTLYTDNDQVDKVEKVIDETDGSVSYILSLKEKYDGYITGQMYGNILKGIINTLAAKQAGISDESETSVEVDGSNKYYTSWMRVIATHNTNNSLDVNQIQVVLYGDNYVPAGRNFPPCELMTIARWGCVDYSDPDEPDYETIKASIIRRQRVFMISTTEGRVVKYSGVDAPILKNGNYGVTIGELPEFVKNYTDVKKILAQVGEHTDWLYAQGAVVGNYIKIDKEGLPVPVTVFCGEWEDGSQMQTPTVGHGIYFYNEYNEQTQQYEIHEVRHNGGRWQCLQYQPVKSGGALTYYEPKWNSPYWRLVDGNDNLTIEFVSSKGYSFRRGGVDTVITPHLFYGNVDITDEVAAEYWSWSRESESGKTTADETWDAQHQRQKTLHLTDSEMPSTWSFKDKAIFTCTVVLNDGKTTRIVDNQIIS